MSGSKFLRSVTSFTKTKGKELNLQKTSILNTRTAAVKSANENGVSKFNTKFFSTTTTFKATAKTTFSTAAVIKPEPDTRSVEVKSVSLDKEKRRIVMVQSDDGEEVTHEFPWMWLRDNCQCSLCYEKSSMQRIVNLAEFDLNVPARNVKYDGAGKVVAEWEDGHVSEHGTGWLVNRSFRKENRDAFQSSIEPKCELWGGDMINRFQRVDYEDILNNDEALFLWLDGLARFGFVLIENVPQEVGCVAKIQNRVAFQRLTHYGPGYDVEVKPDPSNISYTPHRIFMHTDAVFYDHIPGAVLLHCIKQHRGKGGETTLADGFYAANLLKERNPEYYRILSEVSINFADVGSDYVDFDKLTQQPSFVHDYHGNLSKIYWSHFGRHSTLNLDIDKVEKLYTAMRSFDDILNDLDVHIRFKMRPGDVITLNNMRCLHGRTELEGSQSTRHLACGYIDWDEIKSTWRVLRKTL